MAIVKSFPKKERRKRPQRVLWIAPRGRGIDEEVISKQERRKDTDGSRVAIELASKLADGSFVGLLFAVVDKSGRYQFGSTGFLAENPSICKGAALDIVSMASAMGDDPAAYVPCEDD